jgi:exopolysaccharide biosynthesis polyprenyl glycosylphosphotransferase
MPSSRNQAFNVQGLQAADAALVWLGFALAYLVRDPVMEGLNAIFAPLGISFLSQYVGTIDDISVLLIVIIPLTPLVLKIIGFYRNPLRGSLVRAFARIITAVAVMVSAVGLLSLFFKINPSSRAVLILATVIIATSLWLRFLIMRTYWQNKSRRLKIRESIVLAGEPKEVDRFLASLEEDEINRWNVVGRYDLASEKWDEFQNLLHDSAVERVIFATKHSEFDMIATAVEMCEVRGIEAWISANFMQTQVARPSFDSIQGNPMLVLRSTPDLSWELVCKGLMDRVGAFIAIAVSLPLWLVVAIMIKIQSPGPVFYRQERAGRYGRPFWMWKFRTMVVDADKKLEELKLQSGNQMSGPVFKLENDPRIFPFGRILRKFSIDEFPQFINVLVGDMSLVGPRPMAMYELPHIERSEHRRKLSVRPGLTCIWQVSGRNHITSFEEWVDLDLKYIDNWSLWLDIKLLILTIPAVLFAKGAK